MEETNLRLTLSFDGSSYSGWQRQKNAESIQGEIEKSLEAIFKEHVRLDGIGRTDAGAHALSYTANFRVKKTKFSPEKLIYILNRRLPEAIRIHTAEIAPEDFHSRFSAVAREYIYSIIIIPRLSRLSARWLPFCSRYSHLIRDDIDITRLRQACSMFRGEHSFKNFSYGYKNSMNFVRRIHYLRVSEKGPGVVFFIKGTGFLNGMIRSIISACINYSRGCYEIDLIERALEEKTVFPVELRAPVPARGLIFKRGFF